MNKLCAIDSAGATVFRAAYSCSATGRIAATDTHYTARATVKDKEGSQTFTYDYAGRLTQAANSQGVAGWTQAFTYDAAGRMRTNSLVGTYAYANPTVAQHAPSTVTPATGSAQTLTYDQNGNMTAGLDGKAMAYDGENRPLSVTFAGKKTCYVYGADGARLKKIENFGTAQACTAPTASQPVTVYLGPVEVRNFTKGTAEEMTIFPTPDVRIVRRISGATVTKLVGALHRDGLGSVRAVTADTGLRNETDLYRPFGEQAEVVQSLGAVREAKGFIGERYDADAGLQYLNARYYDPRLGMFLQPDWWEVMQVGVGTNRFAYSFNDPVNGRDPTGHACTIAANCDTGGLGRIFRDIFGGLNGSSADATANAKGTLDKMKADAKKAASTAVRTVVDLSPLGTARDLLRSVRGGSFGGTMLAAAGLIPGERIVGGVLGKVAKELVKDIPSAEKVAKVVSDAAATRGGTYSLRNPQTGEIVRNGRTSNLEVRMSQHARSTETGDLDFHVEYRTDSYEEQRGLEQMQIDTQRGVLDKINGISPQNPKKQSYIDAALDYLDRMGF